MATDTDTDSTPTGDDEPGFIRRHPIGLALGTVVGLGIVAFLAFGVFGVQTLFIDEKVDEAGPVFDSGAEAVATTTTTAAPTTTSPTGETAPATTAPPTPDTTAAAPVVRTVSSGEFTGVDHPGTGTANLLSDGNQTFVRFEDGFSTDNGPDLFAVVYVGGDLIELGTLKGNQGAQNYELPADIDPASVDKVAVWCKRFDSTFTEAAMVPNAG